MSNHTKIILIRHGETEWNLSGRWQGHADSALSGRGVTQGEALGLRMENEEMDHFYTSDLERDRPHEYDAFRNSGPEYQVPGGESYHQFYDRCSGALEELAHRHPGKVIGIVTHGGFLGAIFRYVLNIPLDAERNFVLLNCSINRLEKSAKGWNLVSWGDVAHLEGMDSLDDA